MGVKFIPDTGGLWSEGSEEVAPLNWLCLFWRMKGPTLPVRVEEEDFSWGLRKVVSNMAEDCLWDRGRE